MFLPLFTRELEIALEFNGVSATEDMAMVAQIKAEVRKLSNRNDIYNSICVLEKDEKLNENTKRMIYIPPKIPQTPRTSHEVSIQIKRRNCSKPCTSLLIIREAAYIYQFVV